MIKKNIHIIGMYIYLITISDKPLATLSTDHRREFHDNRDEIDRHIQLDILPVKRLLLVTIHYIFQALKRTLYPIVVKQDRDDIQQLRISILIIL